MCEVSTTKYEYDIELSGYPSLWLCAIVQYNLKKKIPPLEAGSKQNFVLFDLESHQAFIFYKKFQFITHDTLANARRSASENEVADVH